MSVVAGHPPLESQDPFYLGSWKPYLEPYTPFTISIRVLKQQATALFHHLQEEIKNQSGSTDLTELDEAWLREQDEAALRELYFAIEVYNNSKQKMPSGHRIKLTGPWDQSSSVREKSHLGSQDFVFTDPEYQDQLKSLLNKDSDIQPLATYQPEELESLYRGDDSHTSANKQMMAFLKCGIQPARNLNYTSLVKALLNHPQICEALVEGESKDGDEFFELFMFEWQHELNPEFEFRGFVYNYQLTCLTQRHTCIYSEEANQNKQVIEKTILELWESNLKHLFQSQNLPNFAIDFFIPDQRFRTGHLDPTIVNDFSQAKVLKISPIAPKAKLDGYGLFSWPEDQQKIEKGPFEFRIVTKIPKYAAAKALLPPPVLELIDTMFPNYHELENYMTPRVAKREIEEQEREVRDREVREQEARERKAKEAKEREEQAAREAKEAKERSEQVAREAALDKEHTEKMKQYGMIGVGVVVVALCGWLYYQGRSNQGSEWLPINK